MGNEKVIGYWVLSNYGGLNVVAMSDCGDGLTVRWYDEEETTECEIIYELPEDAEEGDDLEACINYNGTLYFLSECMRTNF